MAMPEVVAVQSETAETLAARLADCQQMIERLQQCGRQLSLAPVRGCQSSRLQGYQQMRDALQTLLTCAEQGLRDLALLAVVDDHLAGQHAVDGLWYGEGDVRRWCELYLKDTAGGTNHG